MRKTPRPSDDLSLPDEVSRWTAARLRPELPGRRIFLEEADLFAGADFRVRAAFFPRVGFARSATFFLSVAFFAAVDFLAVIFFFGMTLVSLGPAAIASGNPEKN